MGNKDDYLVANDCFAAKNRNFVPIVDSTSAHFVFILHAQSRFTQLLDRPISNVQIIHNRVNKCVFTTKSS